MPPINRVVNKTVIGSIVKDGKTVAISAATETSTWKRDQATAQKVAEVLKKNIANFGPLPEGTVDVCVRETEHMSPADKRNHLTAVCSGPSGHLKTIHVEVKKP